jgi:hypothetical protein
MDFISGYKIYKNIKLKCEPFNKWLEIDNYISGSGGSSNLIILGNISQIPIVIKLIPKFKKTSNEKKAKNNDQMEIVLYKYLTKKYLLGNITPHIVGIYEHSDCHDMSKMFNEDCPSLKDMILNHYVQSEVCQFIDRVVTKPFFEKEFDMCSLEYCPTRVDSEFENLILKFKKKDLKLRAIEDFIYRVSFQIIYSLACLQSKEKNFTHNDFFLRNILGIDDYSHQEHEYVSYEFKNHKFYLKANGFYSKINDFGYTVIYPTIKPNFVNAHEGIGPMINERMTWSPHDLKSDIYNFFHDFYDGSNFGAKSTLLLLRENKIQTRHIKQIKKIFHHFIDTHLIDKINKNEEQSQLLDQIWNIHDISFLKESVKTPKEYLYSSVFKRFHHLPSHGQVIKKFSLKTSSLP